MGPEGSNLKFSENGCDFWALEKSYYRSGFFVDIGASDGVTASNTYLLEKFYKWQGICVRILWLESSKWYRWSCKQRYAC